MGQEDPLEKGMTAHSSILAWRIPWTEEPGGPQSWGHKELDTTEGLTFFRASQVGEEHTCNAGGTRDVALIPGSDSSVEWGHWWLGQKPPVLFCAGPWG